MSHWSSAQRNKSKTSIHQFPSPLQTPTSATDGNFYWRTPQNKGKTPETPLADSGTGFSSSQSLLTPRHESSPGSESPYLQLSREEINSELAKHTHHPSLHPSQALPPVESARQLGSSPIPSSDPLSASGFKASGARLASYSALRTPPSSGSFQKTDNFKMSNPKRTGTDARSLMPPPETPARNVQPSPQFFPSLQFSPDLYHFPMSGPATAPVLPQQKLFWDPSTIIDSHQYQDPYSHDSGAFTSMFPSPGLDAHFPGAHDMSHQRPYDLPGPPSVPAVSNNVDALLDGPVLQTSFAASPRHPSPRKEDPSMFLSSPARRFGGSDAPIATAAQDSWDKPAYHHQIEESRREREVERARKAKAKRLSGAFPLAEGPRRSISPARDLRPGLKRSLTHTGVGARSHLRHQSHVSFADSMSSQGNSSNKAVRGGRSSPIKSQRNSLQLLSSRPRQRTSLSFTIDEDGRAKTVITQVDHPASDLMDLDEDSSSGSESASEEEFDSQISTNKYNAFATSEQEHASHMLHQSRSQPRTQSKISSYSTHTSNSAGKPFENTSSTLVRSAQFPQRGLPPNNTEYSNVVEMEESNSVDVGDAQQALRAIIRERPHSRSTQDGSASGHGSISLSQYNSSPPIQQTNYAAFNNSPTTITDPDAVTPSTDRESLSSNSSTRCVCTSTSSDGHLMIQCESCTKWLHVQCVNIDPRSIPRVYVCPVCVQTPMRHGRIRGSSRASAFVPASPLAHKSQRNR